MEPIRYSGKDAKKVNNIPSHADERQKDARVAFCDGLQKNYAFKLHEDGSPSKVHISQATRSDHPYICPECMSDVVSKKGDILEHHFAHHAPTTNLIGAEETQLHLQSKEEVLQIMQEAFPDGNWRLEVVVMAYETGENRKEKLLQSDICGRISHLDKYDKTSGRTGLAVAIEMQRSSLSRREIMRRTSKYAERGIAVLWIIPIKTPLNEGSLYRPRDFERYLHKLYGDQLYYYTPGSERHLQCVQFKDAFRHIEFSSWFSQDGEELSAGGYEKRYKTIFTPEISPVTIDIIRKIQPRHSAAHSDKDGTTYPERLLLMNNLE